MRVDDGARKARASAQCRKEKAKRKSHLSSNGQQRHSDSCGGSFGTRVTRPVAASVSTYSVSVTSSVREKVTRISVNVSDFAEHPISHSLKGSRIVLESPTAFVPSAAADMTSGADQIDYTSIAEAGKKTFAVLAERGSGAGKDLAIRPTRIVAIGDATFVMNGQLQSRANANRDFFLNCASYLSGTTVADATGTEADRLVTGMDRQGRFRHALLSVLVFPCAVFLLLAAACLSRRLRK